MKMRKLDYQTLARLNESSVRSGRRQNLPPERLPDRLHAPYPVNFYAVHEWADGWDVRMCVVLTPAGQTAWLDVSPQEFTAIPEADVSELEWEAAVCPGTPPSAP